MRGANLIPLAAKGVFGNCIVSWTPESRYPKEKTSQGKQTN